MGTIAIALLLVGCKNVQNSDIREPPPDGANEEGDNFGGDATVRIVSPSNNATLTGAFDLAFTAGDAVDSLSIRVDGDDAVTGVSPADGSATLDLPEGRHTLSLLGLDANSSEVSRDTIVVRTLDDATSFVSVTSPADGALVVNPVQFTFDASDDVDEVEILADGWSLGRAQPGEILSYTFGGTGYSREIEAIAYDRTGDEVASDTLTVTVEAAAPAKVSSFNAKVLELIEEYPTDSSIDYYWPSGVDWSGSTRDILYQDALVADDGGYSSCFCVGMTWEVYLRAWLAIDAAEGGSGTDLHGLAPDDVFDMRTDWFVRDIRGPGASAAFENYGLGVEVESFDDWEPGDFVQFWRHSGSGHNVIFTDWITNSSGARIGFEYWSCNGASSTDGPGYNEEYFGSSGSSIDPMYTYGARAYMPADWY
jgi:hypothetical protein